jgi:hypothetical protein
MERKAGNNIRLEKKAVTLVRKTTMESFRLLSANNINFKIGSFARRGKVMGKFKNQEGLRKPTG